MSLHHFHGDKSEIIKLHQYLMNNYNIHEPGSTEWHQKALELGDPFVFSNIGSLYFLGISVKLDFIKARRFYEIGSSFNDHYAMNHLANIYYEGKCVDNNYEKAIELYQKVTDLGNLDAINNLANMYYEGRGFD